MTASAPRHRCKHGLDCPFLLFTLVWILFVAVVTGDTEKTRIFNQTLDHFNAENQGTWRQRYVPLPAAGSCIACCPGAGAALMRLSADASEDLCAPFACLSSRAGRQVLRQ